MCDIQRVFGRYSLGVSRKEKKKWWAFWKISARVGVSFFGMLDEYLCFITWPSKTLEFSTKYFRFPKDELTVNSDTWWTFLKMQDEMKTKCETLAKFIKQNTQHKNKRKNKERGPKRTQVFAMKTKLRVSH